MDRVQFDNAKAIVADLSRTQWRFKRLQKLRNRIMSPVPMWEKVLTGIDAVIHLAANSSPDASWHDVARHNIEATANVVDAALRHHVKKIVFASSIHVMLGVIQQRIPAYYRPDGLKISHEETPIPVSPYGISKLAGELMGRMAIEDERLNSFIAVRIGTFGDPPPEGSDFRHTGVSPRDLRQLLRRCLDTDATGFQIVYAISGQLSSPFDLTNTREFLSWDPVDAI